MGWTWWVASNEQNDVEMIMCIFRDWVKGTSAASPLLSLEPLALGEAAAMLAGHSSSTTEGPERRGTDVPSAMWVRHLGNRFFNLGQALRWPQMLPTSWLQAHETVSQNHPAKTLLDVQSSETVRENKFKLLSLQWVFFFNSPINN